MERAGSQWPGPSNSRSRHGALLQGAILGSRFRTVKAGAVVGADPGSPPGHLEQALVLLESVPAQEKQETAPGFVQARLLLDTAKQEGRRDLERRHPLLVLGQHGEKRRVRRVVAGAI